MAAMGGDADAGVLEHDEAAERARTARVLLVAGTGLIAAALVVSVVLRPTPLGGHLIYTLMLAVHLGALALMRAGIVRGALIGFTALYVGVALVALARTGGELAPAGFVLTPVVLFAGLTLGGRAAIAVAVVSSAGVLGVLGLAEGGALPDPTSTPPIRLWLVATTALLISGVMLYAALGILRASRARAEAAARAQRELEARLQDSRRLETVGRLAAGVAHDFNNLLTVMFVEVARLARAGGPVEASAGNIRDAAERAAALVRQLLSFGGRQVRAPEDLELGEVVEGLSRLLRRVVGTDVQLVVEPGRERAVTHADRTELEQILLNLVTNARDAMPSGGTVTVRTGVTEPDRRVFLEVSDTGTGIAPEVRDRLFEPFFTTKAVGKGTGLGLATVHTIVDAAGGAILVDSELGAGTTFTVVLPAAAATASAEVAPAEPVVASHGGATILLVDDDACVREAIAAIIADGGHRVATASGARAAMDLVDRARRPFELLITDVVMTELPGPELARRLRERDPGLRVLYLSGYAEERLSERGMLARGVHFLAKPVHRAALLAKIDAVLASDNPGALAATAPGA